jgi:hypothetical protein
MTDPTRPEGITLRDWFAGQLISGFVAKGFIDTPYGITTKAYEYADMMLRVRAEKPAQPQETPPAR